jgi:hypothetical protein
MASQLYHWHLENYGTDTERKWVAWGVVTGHIRLQDTTFIHTSTVKSVSVSEDGAVIIQTKNTTYHCHMDDMNYRKQERYGAGIESILPDFQKWKARYGIPEVPEYHLEENSVLFVMGNNKQYYLGDFIYQKNGKQLLLGRECCHVHVGMIQDSVLCCYLDRQKGIDLDYRYFPYQGHHVSFYSWVTDARTWIENCGDCELYVTMEQEQDHYVIAPGERQLIVPENAVQEEIPALCRRDLYDIMGGE